MQPRWLCSNALFLTFALSIPFGPSNLVAQAEDDADSRAHRSYSLTIPKYKKYLAVMVNIAKAAERRPAVSDALEGFGDLTNQQAVTRFNKVPEMRRAISSAGLTTREFVILQNVIIGTALAHGLMKQGTFSREDSASMTREVGRANLQFYNKNEAELTRLWKEAEAKAPQLKRPPEEEETAQDSEDPDAPEE
jgi:hypothetical protein